jgi:hypothetical protein
MPAGYSSFSTGTKGQKGLLQSLLGQLQGQNTNIQQSPLFQQGSNYLQELLSGSPQSMQAFEAPATRQFKEQTIPQLTSLFGGLGAGSSSGFQQALGQHGAALSENLQALRSGLQFGGLSNALGYAQQPISNYQGFAGLGLGTQMRGVAPRQQNFLQQLLSGLAGTAGQGVGRLGSSFLGGF